MANFVFDALSAARALLFSDTDSLSFGPGLDANDVSITTNGLTTNLAAAGISLDFPALALSHAGQAGLVTFVDGTHLIAGTTAGESINGTDGADSIHGDAGDDNIAARGGHDYVVGGSGADTIDGGDGNDHLYGYGSVAGPDAADSISGGAGSDYIQGNAGDDTLDGGDGTDRIVGGADNDHITAGIGNDSVNGNYGDDRIDGGAGDDQVRGGKGSDVVAGGDGDDQIYGDLGADTLTGGAGVDTFHYHDNDAAIVSTNTLVGDNDTITDFTHGTDHLELGFRPSEVVHGSFLGATLAAAETFAQQLLDGHTGGAVVAVSAGADTLLFYNNSGGTLIDSVIVLQGVAANTIGGTDFV